MRRIRFTETDDYQWYYQLTDSSFSVVAHLDFDTAQVRQRMSYDPWGMMKVLRRADFDGDGEVTLADHSAFDAAYQNLEPAADFSGDGVVDGTDSEMFTEALIAEFFGAPPDEVRISYAAYVRDPLMEILLARHRWYDSRAGRWLTRDPAGYVDGLSLYLFVKGNPLGLVDPTGLRAKRDGRRAAEKAIEAGRRIHRHAIEGVTEAGARLQKSGYNAAANVLFAQAGAMSTVGEYAEGAARVAGAAMDHPMGAGGVIGEGMVAQALQQQSTVQGGMEHVTTIGVARQIMGNAVGATQLSESIFNIDLATGQTLDPIDRTSRALTGSSSMVLTALCPMAAMQKGPPANPNAYSTAFEMRLKPNDFGKPREVHNRLASDALLGKMGQDPQFADTMRQMIPNLESRLEQGRAPFGWTWHHTHSSQADGMLGTMRLVPRSQHRDPTFRGLFHPGPRGSGGYSEWAIPFGAPPNR
jgi:RHS repeat-associated protein